MKQDERDLQAQRVLSYDNCENEIKELTKAKNNLLDTGIISIEAYYRERLYIKGYEEQITKSLINFYTNKIDELEKVMYLI